MQLFFRNPSLQLPMFEMTNVSCTLVAVNVDVGFFVIIYIM